MRSCRTVLGQDLLPTLAGAMRTFLGHPVGTSHPGLPTLAGAMRTRDREPLVVHDELLPTLAGAMRTGAR